MAISLYVNIAILSAKVSRSQENHLSKELSDKWQNGLAWHKLKGMVEMHAEIVFTAWRPVFSSKIVSVVC